MPRGITQAALSGYGNAQNMGETANLRGQNAYNDLFPSLASEVTNPQGYGTVGLNAMNTANQQSIGGADAGAAGTGNLEAARTRNVGGFQPAISEANRAGGRQLSQNALGIQEANENQRQRQQQAGLAGLQGLYGTEMNTALGAGNLSNNFLCTALGGAKQTQAAWNQNLQDVQNAGAGALGALGLG
jgi:hypothetical protein